MDELAKKTHVGEVGNTTTNEEDLALRVHWCPEHEVENGARVVEGLGLGWCTRVFTVVGELAGETGRGNGVSVDDGSTATSDKSPDTTASVEDGQLERGTGLGVHLGNVSLLLGELTAERSRELHWWASINGDLGALRDRGGHAKGGGGAGNGPLDTALELSSLVKLGSKIEEVNLGRRGVGVGDDNERVDLEVTR